MPFQKGHKLAKGRPEGSKNATTLLKEERRAIFDAQISQRWEEIIKQLPPQYIADQYLGKAPDKLEVDAKVQSNVTTDVLDIAEEELKRRKINGGTNTN